MAGSKQKKYTVGIAGIGMVGGALQRYFKKQGVKMFVFDPGKKLGSASDLNKADVVFVCVPTPFDKKKKAFDNSLVEETLAKLTGEKIVVIKSTVLPGTTDRMQKQYPQHKLLFNPEFLTELTADQDMQYPDRQLIGYTSASKNVAGDIMLMLPLAPFERMMPAKEAEMVKYFGNNWFAVKVIFVNQMYDLCQKLGIDYDEVKEAASADKRIGRSHLEAVHKGYRGYGGKCLPKDMKAMIRFAQEHGTNLELHKVADELNEKLLKKQHIKDAERFSKRKGY